MNNRSLLITAGIAGLVMALLSSIPVVNLMNCVACLWLWVGGIFGAWLYKRQEGSINGGQGAAIGAIAGVIGAILAAILGTIFGSVGMAGLSALEATTGEDFLGGALGSVVAAGTSSLIGFLFNIFLFPLFGAIGGAIGGVIFANKPTGPYQPPNPYNPSNPG
jgi:hypothetical protein